MTKLKPAGSRLRTRRLVAHVVAISVLGLLTLGAADSGPVENECIGVEAWVSVLGGSPHGLDDKTCLLPTSCNRLASDRDQASSLGLIVVGVGVWVPHPIHPEILCLVE